MIGRRLAHYEVSSLLGRGGMGEVYRARDTQLDREVALKVLPADFAGDPERLARLRREARVLASLNHPRIAQVYGLHEDAGLHFLVMELAEGEGLDQRIARGAVPVEEAIEIARQLAEGLEEAHELGVVHRDLKPANVMVGRDGSLKILDFGLARAYANEPSGEADPVNSPTITAAMTQAGVVLGTAAYMSPEQARGRALDRRTDIWSFGVIVFEMLTGRRLFEGETISDTMASVLKEPIDFDELPTALPAGVRALVERCLQRDPRLRLRDIGEARIHLGDPEASSLSAPWPRAGDEPAEGMARTTARWAPWILCAALAAVVALLLLRPAERSREAPPLWAALEGPAGLAFHLSGANPAPPALSPDGRRLVYGARSASERSSLWLQELDRPRPERIDGTEGAQYPFWSPDSRSIAFFADGALQRYDLDARSRRELCRAADVKGGCWLENGTIVFASSSASALSKVSAEGGDPVEITSLAAAPVSNSHRLPSALPGGERFVFVARPSEIREGGLAQIMVGSIDGSPPVPIVGADGNAQYASGHLLYVDRGALVARPFDSTAGSFTGPTRTIAEGVGSVPGAALSLFSVGGGDRLVYVPGHSTTLDARLVWITLDGEVEDSIGGSRGLGEWDLSPDGRRIVYTDYSDPAGDGDLWLHDLVSGVRTRLTFDGARESSPLWAPDGRSIYFVYRSGDTPALHVLEPDGRAAARAVRDLPAGTAKISAVSADGRWIGCSGSDDALGLQKATIFELAGDAGPVVVDADGHQSISPIFSPDGRWIAYAANSQGSWRLYLKTFPMTERKWQISEREALWFTWSPDGGTIYHQGSGPELSATDLDLVGESPRIGATRSAIERFPPPLNQLHQFVLAPDGERFLCADTGAGEMGGTLRIVDRWRVATGDQLPRR